MSQTFWRRLVTIRPRTADPAQGAHSPDEDQAFRARVKALI